MQHLSCLLNSVFARYKEWMEMSQFSGSRLHRSGRLVGTSATPQTRLQHDDPDGAASQQGEPARAPRQAAGPVKPCLETRAGPVAGREHFVFSSSQRITNRSVLVAKRHLFSLTSEHVHTTDDPTSPSYKQSSDSTGSYIRLH